MSSNVNTGQDHLPWTQQSLLQIIIHSEPLAIQSRQGNQSYEWETAET